MLIEEPIELSPLHQAALRLQHLGDGCYVKSDGNYNVVFSLNEINSKDIYLDPHVAINFLNWLWTHRDFLHFDFQQWIIKTASEISDLDLTK